MQAPTPSRQRAKRDVLLAERQLQVLRMRATGATYDDIAKALGLGNRGVAHRIMQKALKDVIKEPVQEVVQLELARLDRLLAAIWGPAIGVVQINGLTTNVPPDLFALDRVLSIMQRRAKLLGLDAPIKKQISGEFVMKGAAEQIAEKYGLDADEVLAQAEELLRSVSDA
jgi:hypothetical protein